MKVAIICIAKNEQLYLQEWLDYHLNLGFTQIIVADNDDTLLLSGFSSDKIIVEDYTGIDKVQSKAYTELFQKYRNDYDWIAFFDIDEFLVLDGYTDVKDFLSGFSSDEIRLNCKHYEDNNELDVIDGNYNVFNRFIYEAGNTDLDRFVKCFINTSILKNDIKIYGHGIYDNSINAVDVLNNQIIADSRKTKNLLLVKAWFNHYPTKTIGEYIRQKYNRGGANANPKRYTDWKKYFFRTNKPTKEKIEYAKRIIEQMTD